MRTNFTRRVDAAFGVALQPDGKILAAGRAGLRGGRFALVRYRPNGKRDTSFSGNGRVTTDFSRRNDWADDLVIQTDGKVVVVGQAEGEFGTFALARYDSDGRLDSAFGDGGKATTDFVAGQHDSASAVALQSDGKIVVAGRSGSGPFKFALARYDVHGALDPAFHGDGRVTTAFRDATFTEAADLAIQTDGKIVVAGGSAGRFAVARYLPDGRRDATFGGDGRVTTSLAGGSFDFATALAIQANRRIVVGGTVNGWTQYGVVRYRAH